MQGAGGVPLDGFAGCFSGSGQQQPGLRTGERGGAYLVIRFPSGSRAVVRCERSN